MRIVKHVSLEFREERSDKVYEVDLCQVSADLYVVNFRYGRRGTALREGTKTTAAVSLEQADQIFSDLVESKTNKGYSDPSIAESSEDQAGGSVSHKPTPAERREDPRAQALLRRLAEGHRSTSVWRLSRAVWRAGEMQLTEAEPLLIKLLGTKDSMLDYSIAWSLGQLGGPLAITALRSLEANRQVSDTVRRIAAISLFQLLEGNDRERALDECHHQLPDSVRSLVLNGPSDQLLVAIEENLENGADADYEVLDLLNIINTKHVRQALLQLLKTAPLAPHYFRRIRHIFKAAELRRDAEAFGVIAHRFETTSSFQMSGYVHEPQTTRPHGASVYGSRTRKYLCRRVWRVLQRLGQLGSSDYVPMAAAYLASFTDGDGEPPRSHALGFWDRQSRAYSYRTTYYDRFARYWAFNQIIYGNSQRYGPDSSRQKFCCTPPYVSGGAEPSEREESFPNLWQQQPGAVFRLVARSECDVVHRFAVKVLRDCTDYCAAMELDSVVALLEAPYETTGQFGYELALSRYSHESPDFALVLAMANCAYQPARQQAFRWIGDRKNVFLMNVEFVVAIIASQHLDTRTAARESLKQINLPESHAQSVIVRLVALLHSLDVNQGPLAGDIAETLLRVFGSQLRRIGVEVVRDLFQHSLTEVQQLAGDIVLAHDIFSVRPPNDLLNAMLQAKHESVRGIGMRVVTGLPESALKSNLEFLISLIRHEFADIRAAIRPVILKLTHADSELGSRMTRHLIDLLLVAGAPDGVPSHTARILREDLGEFMANIPSEVVWDLLQSRSLPAQDIGGVLLPTCVRSEDVSVIRMVRLADHRIRSVREAAWGMCHNSVERLGGDIETAAKLLDTSWDDSREFAFCFFRDHFVSDDMLSPKVLVSICDSVRPTVQQFGRELITRMFKQEFGEELVVRLSEHPSQEIQLFSTNFLEQSAVDSPERLRQLSPFFTTILSRVNKGRVAKDRVIRFLGKEAMKSEDAARIVSEIIGRISATTAICDKADTIELMTEIHSSYPSINLPIQVRTTEVRGGV